MKNNYYAFALYQVFQNLLYYTIKERKIVPYNDNNFVFNLCTEFSGILYKLRSTKL